MGTKRVIPYERRDILNFDKTAPRADDTICTEGHNNSIAAHPIPADIKPSS